MGGPLSMPPNGGGEHHCHLKIFLEDWQSFQLEEKDYCDL